MKKTEGNERTNKHKTEIETETSQAKLLKDCDKSIFSNEGNPRNKASALADSCYCI